MLTTFISRESARHANEVEGHSQLGIDFHVDIHLADHLVQETRVEPARRTRIGDLEHLGRHLRGWERIGIADARDVFLRVATRLLVGR